MADTYIFSGGGTGGGIYPALAVIEALMQQQPEVDVLWIGSTHGIETTLVPRAGVAFRGVPAGPLVGVGLRAIPNAIRIAWGTLKAWALLGRSERPAACLITGGWATIPAALAAWLRGVPVVIYLPDVEPGATIKVLSRIAARIAVTHEASRAYLPSKKVVVTGYPVRADLLAAAGYDQQGQPLDAPPDTATQARERFDLDDMLPVLLVFGGSRGARSLNHALLDALPSLLPLAQILHITGRNDWPDVQREGAQIVSRLPGSLADRYHPVDYLHSADMALALAVSDLVVARAGASTLGEFPLFGLPAILVPYPYAWRYQKVNADALEQQGAALRLDDDKLTTHLVPLVEQILLDGSQLEEMAAAAAALRQPGAAARIAALLVDVAAPAAQESRGEL